MRGASPKRKKAKLWTWDDAFRVACGEMGLAPAEFYRLQYCELALILEGYRDRIQHEARRARNESAWLAHVLLLPHTPKDAEPITPAQLLGHKRRKPRANGKKFKTPIEALDGFFAAQSNQGVKQDA